jgi:hypothetical protein
MAKKNPNRKRRNRPLTSKQQNYFKLLCKGMSATEAARRAGYGGEPAHSAYQATRGIRERILKALFEAGLTPEGLVHKYLLPALKAMETEFAKFEGKISDSRDVIAWGPRIQAIRLTAELGGYLAPREVTGKDGGPLVLPKVIDVSGMRSKPASQTAIQLLSENSGTPLLSTK